MKLVVTAFIRGREPLGWVLAEGDLGECQDVKDHCPLEMRDFVALDGTRVHIYDADLVTLSIIE